MPNYFKILVSLIRNNIVREMEFQVSFVLWFVVEILFVFVQIAMVGIYFNFTDNISGWSKVQVFFLIGLFRAIEGIFHIFFYKNLLDFPENISSGNMDLYLTRPVNPLFLASTRYHSLDEIGTFISGAMIIIYSLIQMKYVVSIVIIAKIITSILFGLIAMYSVILIFSTFSFFFTRLTALHSVYDIITKMLRIPINVITGDSSIGNTILFPLIIIVTLPSQIIIGHSGNSFIILEIISSLCLFLIARKFFYFALRHYSSASS